ncbi:Protein of unknown function (DUF3955) [Shewanella psychrophila]|uniref:DUF3955 domain-containing protein n=1 Tax=Shewanella psychrophila TaxID=225848 RepID=A0A1S6HPK1_9GAMM|nr:DUF3955 domain-containing protein [Shewanella psychrophila]AQS37453.1 Protein of unknown function (DUF3955) [Shewanella psychrophila]
MSQKVGKKAVVISVFLLLLGGVFLLLENTFYQYVDEKGFLHESLFLPLGVFSLCLGIIIILLVFIGRFFAKK